MMINPFLQTVLPRAEFAIKRIEKAIWSLLQPLECEALEGTEKTLLLSEARKLQPVKVNTPLHWGCLFDQRWFRVQVPPAEGKAERYLAWRAQGQSLAYFAGVPYYGFDPDHLYCPVPVKGGEFWINNIAARPVMSMEDTGMDEEGCRVDGAFLYTRNDEQWHAFHDLQVLFDLAVEELKALQRQDGTPYKHFGHQQPIELAPPLLRRLLRRLDDAIKIFDREGVHVLRKALSEIYADFSKSLQPLSCRLIGHAHIDLVWLWPERIGTQKVVHSFASVNRIMEQYPELRFTHSQSASYKAVKHISPELHAAVRQRICEGRWEATGALEVESDTMLPCGEALLRSFLLGQLEFEKLSGKPSNTVWLPDVFGYSACLPQLMAEFGVDYFFTTKLTWSAINGFPYSSFVWKGQDGSAVVAHVTQEVGYNGTVDVHQLRLGAAAYRQSDVHDEFLAPTGRGDGGGGPTEAMCERARRMRDLAGVPSTQWDSAEAFFERLGKVRDKLPVYQGELYMECHRGTYTSHHGLKLNFRQAERALQALEAAYCTRGRGEISVEWWERMVFAQFHDYIPGSSLPEVYMEANPELANLRQNALLQAQKTLEEAGGQRCWFNPQAHPVTRYDLSLQKWVVVPPLSGKPAADAVAEFPPVKGTLSSLKNARLEARFSNTGNLISLVVDGQSLELMAETALVLFPDVPTLFDAWELDRQTLDLGEKVDTPAVASFECESPHEATLTFARSVGKASTVVTRFCLRASENILRVTFEVDWQEPGHLLQFAVPTRYSLGAARFGVPFGSVTRSQRHDGPVAEAQWEVPASRWAFVGDDDGKGFALVTEAKYGFSCREGNLAVSLLRSPLMTGYDSVLHRVYPQPLLRRTTEHQHADIGRHTIRLALGLACRTAPRHERPAALADVAFADLLEYEGAPVSAGFLGLEGGDTLQPAWAKPASDADIWILRLHETEGARGEVKLLLEPGWEAIQVNAREQEKQQAPCSVIYFNPYEIVSVKIRRKDT